MKKKSAGYKKKQVNGYWFNNKTSRSLLQEKWKPIPELEETHEVSNYGRVRCLDKWISPPGKASYLRKGHLMSPHAQLAPNHSKKDFTYHMYIGIETKEKKYSFSIRRLVYHCFIESITLHEGFSPDYVIVPKDGNGLNTNYKNLVKLSKSERQQGVYKRKRTVSYLKNLTKEQRKVMWDKGRHKIGRPVTQYDKTGKKITSFSSIQEACKITGIRSSSIGNAVRGVLLTAGGFIWRYGNQEDSIKIPEDYFTRAKNLYTQRVSRPVTQYNLKGERVRIYKSAKEATRITGIASSNIAACLHGRLLSAKGFIWREGKGRRRIGVSSLTNRLWKSRKRNIDCYLNRKKTASYGSINRAEKDTGMSRHFICKIANGEMKSVNGLRWKYK